jgi:hypothetical protein
MHRQPDHECVQQQREDQTAAAAAFAGEVEVEGCVRARENLG